jgi:hypothetical protein
VNAISLRSIETTSGSLNARPSARAMRKSGAASTAYSSRAVLPTPSSPYAATTALAVARSLERAVEHIALALAAAQLPWPRDHPGSLPPGHDLGRDGPTQMASATALQPCR